MQSIARCRDADDEPLLVRPKQACWLLSCGNTHLYELVKSGEIVSFRDGRSRKIVMASLKSFIERRLANPMRRAKAKKERD
jgi:excisionase family DNA binding protein